MKNGGKEEWRESRKGDARENRGKGRERRIEVSERKEGRRMDARMRNEN